MGMATKVTESPRKVFTFYEYGVGAEAGKKLFECESRQGDEVLAQVYLFSKSQPTTAAEYTAKAALEAFLSAESAGNPVVELPDNRRKITVDMVLQLLNTVKLDVTVIEPDETTSDEESAVVENPTDTPGESF